MCMYRLSVRLGVRKLRSEDGLTFKEIKVIFPYLSKGTISSWVRDINLQPKQEKRILEKQLKRRGEFREYNRQKHEKAVRDTKRIMLQAKREIGSLSRRDLTIAGSALYWAEGYNKSIYTIEFANSNPKVILLIMRFFREILEIREDKLKCKMTLHPGISKSECLKFWSNITGIPVKQFNKTWTKRPKSSSGKMHNVLYKGTVVIRICDVQKLRKLKGYIEALN